MNVIKFVRIDIADNVGSIEKAKELAAAHPSKLEFVDHPDTPGVFMLLSWLNALEYGLQESSMPNPFTVTCPTTGFIGTVDESNLQAQSDKNDITDLMSNVQLFHEVFGHEVGTKLRALTREERAQRANFIKEEVDEFLESDDINGQFDAAIDMLYFIFGTLVKAGYSGKMVEEGFLEVQDSNMSKMGLDGKPIYNEVGKIMKGPNYRLPELQKIIDKFKDKNIF